MARRRTQSDETEINITPMLDIVFIMLIFFIVTTSFTRETGAVVLRPEALQAVELNRGTILIGIRQDNQIWIAKRPVDLAQVRQMVERARAENPEGRVVVVADRGSSIGTVTSVVDQAKLAGISGVAIAARQPGGRLE